MSNSWQQVWRQRKLVMPGGAGLADLMAADGYDAFGDLTEQSWRAHVARIAARMRLEPGDSVLEVGCGAGAVLLPLAEAGYQVAGADYSPALVEIARAVLPGARIQVMNAADLSVEAEYDAVIANGVFLYFPDHAFAASVLSRMLAAGRGPVAVLDVPDAACEDEAVAARIAQIGEGAYHERYAGLPHLYFTRDWFADAIGAGYDIEIVDQDLEGYFHTPYRFNVFARPSASPAGSS